MRTLWFDSELFSTIALRKSGAYRYSEACEPLLIPYAWNDEPVVVEDVSGPGEWDAFAPALQWMIDEADEVVIHNSQFDRTVMRACGVDIPIEKIVDTMVMALQHSLPGSLDTLCDVLRVPFDKAKDKDGKKLINLFCKPRAKNVKARRADRNTHPEEWQRFIEYARLDIEAMRSVRARIPKWNDTESERRLWRLDQSVNDMGFAVDLDLARSALNAFQRATLVLAGDAARITGGVVGSTTQRAKLLEHLEQERGLGLPDLKKGTVERMLRSEGLDDESRELLENRQQAAATSPAKYRALLEATCSDSRLRGTLQFCGAARTGRDAGRIFQPQNLPRTPDWFTPERQQTAVDALKAECEELFFDNTVEVVSFCVRGALVPTAGNKLIVADLSNIEGRVLAWLAGEDWKIEAFKAYDRGEGPDLYKVTAGEILGKDPKDVTKDERQQYGKVSELSGGFGGSVGAYRRMGGSVAEKLNDDEILAIVKAWRGKHPATVKYWYALENAARRAIENPGESFTVRDVTFDVREDAFGVKWLRIRLPSGRYLCYMRPEIDREPCYTCNGTGTVRWEDKDYKCFDCGGSGITGKGSLSYEGINQYNRQWERLETYYGRIVENIVQAVARDVFMAGFARAVDWLADLPWEPVIDDVALEDGTVGPAVCMWRLRTPFGVILRVHDELVCEVPDSPEYTGEMLADLMATHTSWTVGLPLAAAGDDLPRYCKA